MHAVVQCISDIMQYKCSFFAWRVAPEEFQFFFFNCDSFSVGKLLLTKARGDKNFGDAEDITHLYKHQEGSHAERLAVYNAVHTSGSQRYFLDWVISVIDLGGFFFNASGLIFSASRSLILH